MPRNAVEEFLTLKKTAAMPSPSAWSGFGQSMSHAAAGGLATAAVGAGIAGIGVAASKILSAAMKSHDFKQMLAANEDLHEHYNTDPKRFNMMFSTLRTMNPEFSKDPLVAGAFMRQMHESPTGIAGIAGEALKHRGDFPNHMMDSVSEYGRAGTQAGLTQHLNSGDKARDFAQRELHHSDTMNAQKAQREQQWNIAHEPEETTTSEDVYPGYLEGARHKTVTTTKRPFRKP